MSISRQFNIKRGFVKLVIVAVVFAIFGAASTLASFVIYSNNFNAMPLWACYLTAGAAALGLNFVWLWALAAHCKHVLYSRPKLLSYLWLCVSISIPMLNLQIKLREYYLKDLYSYETAWFAWGSQLALFALLISVIAVAAVQYLLSLYRTQRHIWRGDGFIVRMRNDAGQPLQSPADMHRDMSFIITRPPCESFAYLSPDAKNLSAKTMQRIQRGIERYFK